MKLFALVSAFDDKLYDRLSKPPAATKLEAIVGTNV